MTAFGAAQAAQKAFFRFDESPFFSCSAMVFVCASCGTNSRRFFELTLGYTAAEQDHGGIFSFTMTESKPKMRETARKKAAEDAAGQSRANMSCRKKKTTASSCKRRFRKTLCCTKGCIRFFVSRHSIACNSAVLNGAHVVGANSREFGYKELTESVLEGGGVTLHLAKESKDSKMTFPVMNFRKDVSGLQAKTRKQQEKNADFFVVKKAVVSVLREVGRGRNSSLF